MGRRLRASHVPHRPAGGVACRQGLGRAQRQATTGGEGGAGAGPPDSGDVPMQPLQEIEDIEAGLLYGGHEEDDDDLAADCPQDLLGALTDLDGRSTPKRTTTTTTTTHGPEMRHRRAQTRRSTRARLLRRLLQGRPLRRRSRRRRRRLRRRPRQRGRHTPLAACTTVALPRFLPTSAATASRCSNKIPDWASSQHTADIRIMARGAESTALCGGGLETRRPAAQPTFFWHGFVARRTAPTTVLTTLLACLGTRSMLQR